MKVSKQFNDILALIPARGGSERIPNKNIVPLNGKPLIAYTIEAATASSYIARVIVSTNSPEIANAARDYGAEVPFLRPDEISGSKSTELEFLEHALHYFNKHEGFLPSLIVQLYPTTPLRKASSIDRAVEKIIEYPQADSLRSVRLCSEHPHKMWTIENDRLYPFVHDRDTNRHTLSYQLLPTVYIQNASIYIVRPSTILEKRTSIGIVVIPFVMDEIESIDINSPLDIILAEALMRDR